MDPTLRDGLIASTQQALKADDWPAVEQIWQPHIDQGDLEAYYQLAYHYLRCSLADDDAIRDRMYHLLRQAAAKDHPDAVWFLADAQSPTYASEILRVGHLGSKHAQQTLGALYATGDWTGPQDLTEAIGWYRRAAEQGELESQYELGFMLLLGEGEPRNIPEGLEWLERAAEAGQTSAMNLLADCYENGFCEVPKDEQRAAHWRKQYEDSQPPTRRYRLLGPFNPDSVWSSRTSMALSTTAAGTR